MRTATDNVHLRLWPICKSHASSATVWCHGRMGATTVSQVLARMREISAEVPHGDGAGVFNNVYLRVTEMVASRLKTPGVFDDDAFIADLDVRFAGSWFDAYDSTAAKPKAWAPLFAGRKRLCCRYNSRSPA
jgi:hypothetical protein